MATERSFGFLVAAFFLLFSLLLAGVAGEIILRLLQDTDADPAGGSIQYRQHPGYFTYAPNNRFAFVNEGKQSIVIASDEFGLRNPSGLFAQAETWLLGDSFIAAANTSREQTLAAQLNAYNAGMDGFSTIQAVTLLRALLKKKTPRQVVLAFYLGNDFRDNLSIASTGAGNATALSSGGFCAASRVCQALYVRLYLGVIQGQSKNPMASYALAEMSMLRDTPTPGAMAAQASTRAALAELASLSREKGFRVLVVGIPSKAQVMRSLHEISGFADDPLAKAFALETIAAGYEFDRPDTLLRTLCADIGLPFVSLLTTFRAQQHKGLYYQIDPHWTVAGQTLASGVISAALPLAGDLHGLGAEASLGPAETRPGSFEELSATARIE